MALGVLVLALLASGCTDAPAERGGGVRMSDVAAGFVDRQAEVDGPAGPAFLAALAALSHGALVGTPAPRPGREAQDVLDEVRRGDLKLAWLRTASLEAAGLRQFSVLQAPFLVTTPQAQRAVTESGAAGSLLESLESVGVVGLSLWGGALARPIATEQPLLGLPTWAGRRVRSLSPTESATFEAFGAVPVEVLGDLNQLVPAGIVDAAVTDLRRQQVAADYTIAPYLTGDVVLWSRFSVLVANQQWYASLGEQEQRWLRDAAEQARRASVDESRSVLDENGAITMCEAGARFAQAGHVSLEELEGAAGSVRAGLRADAHTGPLVREMERVLAAADADGAWDPVDVPGWCAGAASPLQPVTRVPQTRAPIPPGTYRTHLSADDIAAAGVGKVQDAQVVTLVIGEDGSYTNASRFDDDASVMVFEAGQVRGDAEELYFVNDLDELQELARSGVNACVWTDPSLGCITNTAPYTVRWRLLADGSIELSDPRGVNPDPVLVLTIVANPYRKVR